MVVRGGRNRVYKSAKAYQTHQLNERRAGNVNSADGKWFVASKIVSEKIAKSHFGRSK